MLGVRDDKGYIDYAAIKNTYIVFIGSSWVYMIEDRSYRAIKQGLHKVYHD